MLEIIALIFLTGTIGMLAKKKGKKSGLWKLYTVLSWFGCEIVGMILSVIITKNTNIIMLGIVGLAFGFGGYLLVKYILEKMPDVNSDWIEHIGEQE